MLSVRRLLARRYFRVYIYIIYASAVRCLRHSTRPRVCNIARSAAAARFMVIEHRRKRSRPAQVGTRRALLLLYACVISSTRRARSRRERRRRSVRSSARTRSRTRAFDKRAKTKNTGGDGDGRETIRNAPRSCLAETYR